MCARLLLSTKIGDTLLSPARARCVYAAAKRRNRHIHTRISLARSLACELSWIASKHGEICFFLHRLLLFLLAFLCVWWGGACILIYENRSTACTRRAGARDSLSLLRLLLLRRCRSPLSLLTARTICSSYLSLCPCKFASTERLFLSFRRHSTLPQTDDVYVYACICAYRFFSSHSCVLLLGQTPTTTTTKERTNDDGAERKEKERSWTITIQQERYIYIYWNLSSTTTTTRQTIAATYTHTHDHGDGGERRKSASPPPQRLLLLLRRTE